MAAAGHDRYPPITTREVFSLNNLGINEQLMTTNHITVESDKYICIRETDSVTIIDINEHTNRLEIDKIAASAIMNPCAPILAYIKRDGTTLKDKLRTYNVETKMKMKAYNMNEKVVFWKWITPTMLGLVTQTAVHHWSTEGSAKPVKVFDRSANLATSTIISYQCDPSEKWCALIGTWRDPLFSGKMQLFSVEEQSSQEFDALVADFTTFEVPEDDAPSTLICFATGSVTYERERYRIQLNVIELGKPGFAKKQAEFRIGYWPGFPFSLQVSEKYGWVSVITKRGLVIMHDLETASPIYSYNISDHYMILAAKSKTGGGFYSINEGGQVLLTQVNEYTIMNEEFLLNDDVETTQHLQGLCAFLVRSKKRGHLEQKNIREIDRVNQSDELIKERDDLKWRLFRLESASSNDLEVKLTEFTYEQIRDVTNNFSDSLKIGEGGFGQVYKPINGHPFAIKKPIDDRSQVTQALNQELEISTKLRHPNIAKVLGICKEPLILIYELMPNGSLYDILGNEERSKELTWKKRICIASNICEALKYIHSSEPPLVHGDLTPANILLDSNYTAKLTDFGIGRYLQRTTTRDTPHHYTEQPKGVREYIDPTYFNMGEMTTQNDIYSLGIILLQLVTRKDPWGLRKTAERALVNGQVFVDASAGEWPLEQAKKMLQLGLRCSDISRKNRPDLVKEVMVEIESMRRASLRF